MQPFRGITEQNRGVDDFAETSKSERNQRNALLYKSSLLKRETLGEVYV